MARKPGWGRAEHARSLIKFCLLWIINGSNTMRWKYNSIQLLLCFCPNQWDLFGFCFLFLFFIHDRVCAHTYESEREECPLQGLVTPQFPSVFLRLVGSWALGCMPSVSGSLGPGFWPGSACGIWLLLGSTFLYHRASPRGHICMNLFLDSFFSPFVHWVYPLANTFLGYNGSTVSHKMKQYEPPNFIHFFFSKLV